MMRTRTSLPLTLAALAAILMTAFAPAMATPADDLALELGLGVLSTDLDDGTSSKFEEYRDLGDGFLLDALGLRWVPDQGAWSLSIAGENVLRDDERYGLDLRQAGRLRFTLGWDQTPHLFARDATTLHRGDGSNLVIDATTRAALEADPSQVPSVLAAAGRSIDIGLSRDTATAGFAYRLTDGWDLAAKTRHEEREGTRRLSVGTYVRKQAVEAGTGAGTFDRERFDSRGIELPAPVDYRTSEWGVSTTLHRKFGFVTLGLEDSAFSNRTEQLFWDNPFEAPPSVASASDRGRFARGALALDPDNEFDRLHATLGLNLPGRTRIQASWATGTMTQDSPFMPFTQNEALKFPGPDGVAGTADDVAGSSLSLLPASSLDGEVETTFTTLRLSTNPWEPLTLRAAWRSYEYDNKTPELIFPGYAAFGESAYRHDIGKKLNGTLLLFSEPGGYERTAWSVGGAWRFGHAATLDLDYGTTTWDYEGRQVDKTAENALQVRLHLEPAEWVTARLSYLDAQREFDGAYDIGLEGSRVRAFDVWDRDRTRYGLELDFVAGEAWTFGFAWTDWKDEYPGVVNVAPSASNPYASFPYGLNEVNNQSISASATYAAERWNLSLAVGRDESEWISMAVVKTTLASDSVQFDPANQWIRNQDDQVDWANLAFDADLKPEKLHLRVDLTYSAYDGDQLTTNPNTPNINSGVAYAFPSLSSDYLSSKLTLGWTLNPRMGVELAYWYEPYRLDDFMWDAVEPWMQGIVTETTGSPAQFRNGAMQKFLLMDATYSDYTANVLSLVFRLHL